MPVNVYFREAEEMPELEWARLQIAGKVLVFGAGAGKPCLVLQQMGHEITALDSSPKAAEIMKLRGVKKSSAGPFFDLPILVSYGRSRVLSTRYC